MLDWDQCIKAWSSICAIILDEKQFKNPLPDK